MCFFGFRLKYKISDHTTLYIFSNEIVTKKAYELLLKKINNGLGKHQALVKIGVIVDAYYSESSCFKGNSTTYVVEDRKEEE
ncbi:MAG: hypothetical protein ACMUEL_08445 [Flavobacteriales bacterium Tduv]